MISRWQMKAVSLLLEIVNTVLKVVWTLLSPPIVYECYEPFAPCREIIQAVIHRAISDDVPANHNAFHSRAWLRLRWMRRTASSSELFVIITTLQMMTYLGENDWTCIASLFSAPAIPCTADRLLLVDLTADSRLLRCYPKAAGRP